MISDMTIWFRSLRISSARVPEYTFIAKCIPFLFVGMVGYFICTYDYFDFDRYDEMHYLEQNLAKIHVGLRHFKYLSIFTLIFPLIFIPAIIYYATTKTLTFDSGILLFAHSLLIFILMIMGTVSLMLYSVLSPILSLYVILSCYSNLTRYVDQKFYSITGGYDRLLPLESAVVTMEDHPYNFEVNSILMPILILIGLLGLVSYSLRAFFLHLRYAKETHEDIIAKMV